MEIHFWSCAFFSLKKTKNKPPLINFNGFINKWMRCIERTVWIKYLEGKIDLPEMLMHQHKFSQFHWFAFESIKKKKKNLVSNCKKNDESLCFASERPKFWVRKKRLGDWERKAQNSYSKRNWNSSGIRTNFSNKLLSPNVGQNGRMFRLRFKCGNHYRHFINTFAMVFDFNWWTLFSCAWCFACRKKTFLIICNDLFILFLANAEREKGADCCTSSVQIVQKLG